MASAGSQLHPRVKVTRFPSYFDSNGVDSQLMPCTPFRIKVTPTSESVTLTRNGVDSQLTPFRVKFDSADILHCITVLQSICGSLYSRIPLQWISYNHGDIVFPCKVLLIYFFKLHEFIKQKDNNAGTR